MDDKVPVRQLEVTIILGKGSFGEDGAADTATLKGYRVSANVTKMGAPGFDNAQLRVFGVTPSLMNQLSTLGKSPYSGRINTVAIRAGDDQSGLSLVYTGIIMDAFQDFNGAPDSALNIISQGSGLSLLKPIPPVSYPSTVSKANAFQDVAARMGVLFENHGVTGTLPPTYLPGTAADQLRRLIEAADVEGTVDNGTLVIWPKGGSIDGLVPDVGPASGLVGYPEYSGSGRVRLRCLYRPGFRVNGEISLTTSLSTAAGPYLIQALSYELESETPDGRWFANIEAWRKQALTS